MISILLWLVRCSMRLANQLSSLPHFSSRMENNEKFFIHFSRVPEQSRESAVSRGFFSLLSFFYIITPPSVVNTQNILPAVAPGPTWPSFTTLSTDQRKRSEMETTFFLPFFSPPLWLPYCVRAHCLDHAVAGGLETTTVLLLSSRFHFFTPSPFSLFLPPQKFIVYVSSLDLKQESAWEGLRREVDIHTWKWRMTFEI